MDQREASEPSAAHEQMEVQITPRITEKLPSDLLPSSNRNLDQMFEDIKGTMGFFLFFLVILRSHRPEGMPDKELETIRVSIQQHSTQLQEIDARIRILENAASARNQTEPVGPLQQDPSTTLQRPQSKEGNTAKFKADILFDGKGDLVLFLFALKQSLNAYHLHQSENQLIALGRSLRGDALNWWMVNEKAYSTLDQALEALKRQFLDLTLAGNNTRKIIHLTQTGNIRDFFLEVDRLNVHANLPTEALWKILREALKPQLRIALIPLQPKPTTYSEWKQAAIEIGAELETIAGVTNNRTLLYKPRIKERGATSETERVTKEQKDSRLMRGACIKCGRQGHRANECRTGWRKPSPKQGERFEEKDTTIKMLENSNNEIRKRRQGDPHYPVESATESVKRKRT